MMLFQLGAVSVSAKVFGMALTAVVAIAVPVAVVPIRRNPLRRFV